MLGQRQIALSNNTKRDNIKIWKTDIATVYCRERLGACTAQQAIHWQNLKKKKSYSGTTEKPGYWQHDGWSVPWWNRLFCFLSVWSSIVALYVWPLKLNIIADRLVLACRPCLADQWSRRQLSGHVVIYVKGWRGQIVTHEGLALFERDVWKENQVLVVSDKTVQRFIRMCHTANRAMLKLHNKNECRAIPGQPVETFFMICY